MHLKLLTVSKREIQKTAKVTSDSSGNKIADRTTKVWKISPHNSTERVKNEHDKEIHKERYIPLEETENYWSCEINIIV